MLYGELDPSAVAPFVKYGEPLSNEGRRLASLLNRAMHGRLPITADLRLNWCISSLPSRTQRGHPSAPL